MAAAAALRITAACSRIKPEVYETSNGKVIVEDEFLNFISIKIKTLSQDEIVLLASNNFSSDWIEHSKKLLFELCPTTQRNIKHKGTQKDVNNVKDCLKLLNERGEDIPRFVSHYLDELPPVGIGNMDTSALLGRMERLSREVSTLRGILETQASVSENFGAATAALDRRMTEIEEIRGSSGRASTASGSQERETLVSAGLVHQALEETASTQTSSPAWNIVVKEGRRKPPQKPPKLTVQLKPGRKQTRSKRETKMGIVGTGTDVSNIPVIKTKLVSVFATRFSPDLDADTLRDYLTGKLGNSVMCRKIETTRNRFSSFHVTAECNEVGEIYEPQLWPEGIYVRRYFEARRPKGDSDSAAHISVGEAGLQQQCPMFGRIPVAPQGSSSQAAA